jgi:hypothetical protein
VEILNWIRLQWDRALAIASLVVGVVVLLLGYLGVSRSTLPTEQIPYLASGGLFGLLFLGIAATLWLSADLGDEWRKLDDIHAALRSVGEPASDSVVPIPHPIDGRGL